MNRRDFLKLSVVVSGGLLIPRPQIEWPEVVKTSFETPGGFAFTVDDGFDHRRIRPMMEYIVKFNIKGTWFSNGRGMAEAEHLTDVLPDLKRLGWEIGYHTMHHPSVEDQARNYDYARWCDDYDEWHELAESFGMGMRRRYARAAGGYFSDPFLAMCAAKDLMPVGWSKDPYVLVRGETVVPGDIMLTHFRDSEWPWFQMAHSDLWPPACSLTTMRILEILSARAGAWTYLRRFYR